MDRHECCTLWWLRHCLKRQARKTPRLTVRWAVISMQLPEGPGVAISVDYFGSLPVTPRGNTYILLITDCFSRRADTFPVAAAEFAAEGTANIPVNKNNPLWVYPHTLLTDCGLRSAPSFHKLYTSCWGCVIWPQTSIIPTATEALTG